MLEHSLHKFIMILYPGRQVKMAFRDHIGKLAGQVGGFVGILRQIVDFGRVICGVIDKFKL